MRNFFQERSARILSVLACALVSVPLALILTSKPILAAETPTIDCFAVYNGCCDCKPDPHYSCKKNATTGVSYCESGGTSGGHCGETPCRAS